MARVQLQRPAVLGDRLVRAAIFPVDAAEVEMELVGVRRDVAFTMEKFAVSERGACELNDVDRSSYRYEPHQDRDAELRDKLRELARQKPRFGYRRLGVLLEKNGVTANHKRLFRAYQEAGLGVRRRERKRLENYDTEKMGLLYKVILEDSGVANI